MSEEVLGALLERLLAPGRLGSSLSVLWHAGEPLTLPVSYYDKAISKIRARLPPSVAVSHDFQTNGTLINEEWCEFFGRPDVGVGVSTDGPKNLHDLHRTTRRGGRTFDRTIAGLRMLRKYGVELRVISVLTRQALFFPDELFDFYVAEGVSHVAFNIDEIDGINPKSSLEDPRCESLFTQFFARFIERCSHGSTIKSVRELDHVFSAIVNPRHRDVQNKPFAIVSVAADGDFTTYSPELLGMTHSRWGNFALGNVLTDDFDDAEQSEKFQQISKEIQEGVQRCRDTCEYFDVCGGGAPGNKLFETGRFDATETLHCRYVVKKLTHLGLKTFEQRGYQTDRDRGH